MDSRIRNPIAFWTGAAFLGLFVPCAIGVIKKRRITTTFRDLLLWGIVSGYGATVVNSSLWRVYEGRGIESSEVLEKLVSID